ncbi:MAG: tripartite tricarboxylate transporter TctB family protein [Lautropia sp.]
MRRPHLVLAVALFGLAAFVGFAARELDYMTPLGPGPGFFPLWLAGLLALLAVLLFVDAARRPREALPAGFVPAAADARRLGLVLAVLIVATAMLPTVGFALSMLALNLAVLAALGRRGLGATAISLLGSFGVAYLFTTWLAVPLPKGWLGW